MEKSKLPPRNQTVRDYKHLNVSDFKADIETAPWWICTTFEDIDDIAWPWEIMYNDKEPYHIKKRKARVRSESLPWVDENIRKLMNQRYKLLISCDGTDKTSGAWSEYRKVKNKVNKLIRKAEARHWKKQFDEAQSPQDFWKIVNKIRKKKVSTRVGPLRQGKEPIKTNDKEKAELMNNFFVNNGKELAEKLSSITENKHSLIHRVTPVMKHVQIGHEKMTKHIKKVKPGKSSGPDNVMSRDISVLVNSLNEGLRLCF